MTDGPRVEAIDRALNLLTALAEAGAAGALVATALHGGGIEPGELRGLP